MSSSPHPNLDALQRDGFVVIRNLLTPSEINHYRTIATAATTKTRTGGWPHFRTVPKQFPPWPTTPPPASEGGIWGVQHLLHLGHEGSEAHRLVLYVVPLLLLAVADAAAALVGVGFGRRLYRTIGGWKTMEGSAAFLACAFLCVFIALIWSGDAAPWEALVVASLIAWRMAPAISLF